MRTVGLVIFALAAGVGSMWLHDGSDANAYIKGLRSSKEQQRKETVEAIGREREELIKQLVQLAAERVQAKPATSLDDPNYIRHGAKEAAILLLGELRASESVVVLIENLEYKNPHTVGISYYSGPDEVYPASRSLIEIGMPAIGPTVEKLGGYEEDELGRRLCCWITNRILGRTLGMAYLERAIEQTKDPRVRQNLEAAVVYFKTLDKKSIWERRSQKEKKRR